MKPGSIHTPFVEHARNYLDKGNLRRPIPGERPSRSGPTQYRTHSSSAYTRAAQSQGKLGLPLAAIALGAGLAYAFRRRSE